MFFNFDSEFTPATKKKTIHSDGFLFGTMCSLRERDAHCVRDASFGRDVRLRRVSRNTSHHCERSEQHHCAEHNITCPRGQASLYKADVFCYTWFERICLNQSLEIYPWILLWRS